MQQLLKLLPQLGGGPATSKCQSETDEEIDASFASNVSYLSFIFSKGKWILDTGATDHITFCDSQLTRIRCVTSICCINLPNGQRSPVKCIGDIELQNGLALLNTLCLRNFKFNLLSVSKLAKDNKCLVCFNDHMCVIQDCVNNPIKGIGIEKQGLYYLVKIYLKF